MLVEYQGCVELRDMCQVSKALFCSTIGLEHLRLQSLFLTIMQ